MMDSIVLMYHCVYDKNINESGFLNDEAIKYKIRLNEFEEQVVKICGFIKNKPNRKVLFSFDDGGVSFFNVIAPILEKYDLRGLFFITTSYINKPGFLSDKQILDLYLRGHTIGTHSHSHPEIMSTMSEEEILHEWQISCEILERIIGEKIQVGSIPNGFSSDLIINCMIRCGIRYIYTSKPTVKEKKYGNNVVYGRFAVTNKLDIKRILSIISSNTVRNIIFLKYEVLEIIKKVLGKKYILIRRYLLKNISK